MGGKGYLWCDVFYFDSLYVDKVVLIMCCGSVFSFRVLVFIVVILDCSCCRKGVFLYLNM